jgi:hypothetical protein
MDAQIYQHCIGRVPKSSIQTANKQEFDELMSAVRAAKQFNLHLFVKV